MTTLGKIPFTEREKTIIGDFIHAIDSGTLIISECESLVEVLANHNLITNKQELLDKIKNKDDGIVGNLRNELTSKVSSEQGSEIMAEYYGMPIENTDKKQEESENNKEQNQHYCWGVGK